MDPKLNLMDLSIEELEKILYDIKQEKYRAKQIFKWIHRGVSSVSEMTDLSVKLREQLSQIAEVRLPKVSQKLESAKDETVKYLLQLSDGNAVESVLMSYHHGYSICISTQVGCRMGCRFCASTGAGFMRNLSAGEILGQVLAVSRDSGKRISNIVIMGIGEPLDNYNNTVKFLRLVNHPDGVNIGFRHISLSTSGLVPQILRFSEEGMPVTLSVSLHAPNDRIRTELMPVNKSFSIDTVLDACRKYVEKTKRRISVEYAIIQGINDSPENAAELANRLRGLLCHINLIPVNEVPGGEYKRSPRPVVERFVSVLTARGFEATVRRELGTDINAACGQLRRQNINKPDTHKDV